MVIQRHFRGCIFQRGFKEFRENFRHDFLSFSRGFIRLFDVEIIKNYVQGIRTDSSSHNIIGEKKTSVIRF